MTTTSAARKLINVVQARPMSHGTGFNALSMGRNNLGDGVDPFIQLDHYFMSQPTFGPHPHAGFSAVTYMFEDSAGSFANRDSRGDHSLIRPGDLHWTQAGSGIIHDEIPVGQNAFVLVIQGQGNFGADAQALSAGDGGLFDQGGDVIHIQTGEQPTQYVLCAGQPLNEPIVSHGPFIMNSAEHIQRVVAAYQAGQMGQLT